MENQQTDTDARGPFAPGVGAMEQNVKKLYDLQPNWVADGFGIRGPQRPESAPESARPTEMNFGLDQGGKKGFGDPPTAGACAPTTPPASGTHVWGAVSGACQWIPTCDATCGT